MTDRDLIPLQASHITQLTSNGKKSTWSVQKNITDEELLTFPKHFSEDEIFHIMDFAKKYEMEALTAGITFQKDKQNQALKSIIDQQKEMIIQLGAANDTLATALHTEMCRNEV